jgi:hypothetical protein
MSDGEYWAIVDTSRDGYSRTYEHDLPHGKLVRIETLAIGGRSNAVVFVPAPTISVGPW